MRYRVLAILMIFIVVISLTVAGCESAKSEEIATELAKHWTSENVSYISEDIARTIGGDIPVSESMLISIIEEQVSKHVIWTYSDPEKLSSSAYEVIARTTLTYEIPQIGSGSVDVGFHLTCLTSEEQKEVASIGVTYYSYNYTSI